MSTESRSNPKWLPLESNPALLNAFVHRLGLPPTHGFVDVWGLDPDLLAMLPSPVLAMCLLYPSANISEPRRSEMRGKSPSTDLLPGLFFAQQHDECGNACGTLACMHAVVNGAGPGMYRLEEGSVIAKFRADTTGMTSYERGRKLVECEAMHEESNATARSGETEGAGTDDNQDQHFIGKKVWWRGGELL